MADTTAPGSGGRAAASRRGSARRPDVQSVSAVQRNAAGTAALATLTPRLAPQDKATEGTRARPPPPRRAERDRRHRIEGAHRRQTPRAASTSPMCSGSRLPIFIGGRAGPELPAPAARVPVDPRAAQGRADEPALDRRRVRSRRRHLPVGLGRRVLRCQQGADRGVGPDDAVRHRVRALHGLRGVPVERGARALRPHPRQRRRRRRRTREHRARHHRGRADHGVRLRQLRGVRPPGLEARSGSASPSRSPSTHRSFGSSSCPRRWSCSATPTGGCPAGSGGSSRVSGSTTTSRARSTRRKLARSTAPDDDLVPAGR